MNPIHVNCPDCQKLFMVREEDLSVGQARFRCTTCDGIFAFNWPQPPGIAAVRAYSLDSGGFTRAPKPEKTFDTNGDHTVRTCPQCGERCDADYSECPRCRIVFERAKVIKLNAPAVPVGTPELNKAWEEVKEHYGDEQKHQNFIQFCLNRDNLPFASNQYRVILQINPSDETAIRMQKRIIELATLSYVASQGSTSSIKDKINLTKIIYFFSGVLIAAGLMVPALRPMIALGTAVIAFVFFLRFFR